MKQSTRQWLFLASGAVVYAAAVGWAATVLPVDGVPLHFRGWVADRIGSRTEALVLLAALGAGLLALGALVVGVGPRRRPRTGPQTAAQAAPILGGTLAFLSFIPVWMVLAADGADLSPLVALAWAVPAGLGSALFLRTARSARDRVV